MPSPTSNTRSNEKRADGAYRSQKGNDVIDEKGAIGGTDGQRVDR
jgi:hypothetical protein